MATAPRVTQTRSLLFALLLILVFATGLRLLRIDHQSLWYDEGASLRYALRGPVDIWRNTAADIHPPGYYFVLSAWVRVFGTSELALRGMSALFGVVVLAQVYVLGRKLFHPAVGLLAAALLAVDPFHIYYSQEARMYTLLASLGAASLWLVLRWLDTDLQEAARLRRWLPLLALAIVNAAAMYTHYIFPFFIAVESLLVAAWWLWERDPESSPGVRVLVEWVGVQAVTFLLYLPWLPTALDHVTSFPRAQVAVTAGEGLVEMGTVLAYGITLTPEAAAAGLVPLALLALVGLLPPVEVENARPSHFWRAAFVLAWLVIPVSAMFAFRLYQGGYLRFILPADLALALLVGRGIWMGYVITRPRPGPVGVPGVWVTLVVIVLAAFALAPTVDSLTNLYFNPEYARDDYRGIARYLKQNANPEDAIILNGPAQWEVFTYYYPPTEAVIPMPYVEDPVEQLDEILATADRVYGVYYGESERDPERVVEGTLERRAFEANTEWYGDVRVVTYGVASEPVIEPQVTFDDIRFGEDIRLLGYTLEADDARPGGLLKLALFWTADGKVDESYTVFVHLLGEDGTRRAQHDSIPGALQFTTMWEPGETVQDHHGLLIPDRVRPGDYTLSVGFFLPETGERLPVTASGESMGDNLSLATVSVR